MKIIQLKKKLKKELFSAIKFIMPIKTHLKQTSIKENQTEVILDCNTPVIKYGSEKWVIREFMERKSLITDRKVI